MLIKGETHNQIVTSMCGGGKAYRDAGKLAEQRKAQAADGDGAKCAVLPGRQPNTREKFASLIAGEGLPKARK
jgi:hypothetical protein